MADSPRVIAWMDCNLEWVWTEKAGSEARVSLADVGHLEENSVVFPQMQVCVF